MNSEEVDLLKKEKVEEVIQIEMGSKVDKKKSSHKRKGGII